VSILQRELECKQLNIREFRVLEGKEILIIVYGLFTKITVK